MDWDEYEYQQDILVFDGMRQYLDMAKAKRLQEVLDGYADSYADGY